MKNKAKKNVVELVTKYLFTICAVIAIFAVCSITVYMILKGTPAFHSVGVLDLLFGTTWKPTA
ncbi:MAG: phosphate ABC transporter permease subunit PstC, partial [Lachnospiraceae bacterium]|nr:phosphate ABC transporter permease subunit PstC [Lachnospiraceae bacterium]